MIVKLLFLIGVILNNKIVFLFVELLLRCFQHDKVVDEESGQSQCSVLVCEIGLWSCDCVSSCVGMDKIGDVVCVSN